MTMTISDNAPLPSPDSDLWPTLIWRPIPPTARACCCPAMPLFQAVLPSSTAAQPTELLLCAHHYRRSAARLRELGCAIYDRAGRAVVLPEHPQAAS